VPGEPEQRVVRHRADGEQPAGSTAGDALQSGGARRQVGMCSPCSHCHRRH
jgi:hypothetical protein